MNAAHDYGETKCCPACRRSELRFRTRHAGPNERWRCLSCGETFKEAATRERMSSPDGATATLGVDDETLDRVRERLDIDPENNG